MRDCSLEITALADVHAALDSVTMVLVVENDATISYANPLYYQISGFTPDDVLGKPYHRALGAFTNERLHQEVGRCVLAGRTWSGVLEIATKDKTPLWVEDTVIPFLDEQGRLRRVVSLLRDITAQKAAEDALARSRDELYAIQRAGHVGSWEWDLAADKLKLSPEIIRIYGLADAEHYSWNDIREKLHPEDAPRIESLARTMAEDGMARVTETRVCPCDGVIRMVSIEGAVVRDDAGAIVALRGTSRDITEQREAQRDLEHLALHDPLTGLPNRRMFTDRLRQAISNGANQDGLAILFLDLDGFKEVNDTLGHGVGDLLLTKAAKRIRSALRHTDLVARLGGDEFAVLLQGIGSTEGAEVAADAICSALRRPFLVEDYDLYLSVSVGITLHPQHAQSAEALLQKADMAMYRSKAAGRNRYTLFMPEWMVQANRKATLMNELRSFRTQGQMYLVYQPQVSLETGAISAAEALLRWRHPNYGELSPAEFIPLMEETGMIGRIGDWVLGEACREAKRWADLGTPITICVNVSFRQLAHERLSVTVRRVLSETGLDPKLLELELTESAFDLDVEQVPRELALCREMGVRVAIDDFGTGYSNLGHLRRYQVDNLKVDRMFTSAIVNGGNDVALVKTVVEIAKIFGLVVVAEGIESEGVAQLCRELGCKYGQGFHFSRPLPADAFRSLLNGTETPHA